MFKLGLIQMSVEGGNYRRNLRRAELLVGQAAEAGANVVVLPETMDLGWAHSAARKHATPVPDGETCDRLARLARRHDLYVCSGLTEKAEECAYNAAVLLNRKGKVILHHRKINELAIGQPYYGQGDRLGVYHSEFGTIGVLICADAGAPDRVLTRSLCCMGADFILSPCAWAMPADHDNHKKPYGWVWRDAYIPVAKEYAVWIVGVSYVGWITSGPWKGRACIGNSLVIGPDGAEVLRGPYGAEAESVLYVDVDPAIQPAPATTWRRTWGRRMKTGE